MQKIDTPNNPVKTQFPLQEKEKQGQNPPAEALFRPQDSLQNDFELALVNPKFPRLENKLFVLRMR